MFIGILESTNEVVASFGSNCGLDIICADTPRNAIAVGGALMALVYIAGVSQTCPIPARASRNQPR